MKIFFLYIILFLLLQGCRPNQEINSDIVLQVGEFSFSQTAYDFQIEKLKRNNRDTHQYRDQLIDEAYILAFAKQNRFDTIAELDKRLLYAMKFYISQVDGYLWNKIVKPKLELSNSMLQETYQRKTQRYQFELLRFQDTSTDIAQYEIIDKKKFDDLKKKISPNQFYNIMLSYPFLPYGAFTDELENAQTDDIIGPFQTDQGIYLMRVVKMLPTSLPPFPEIENTLRQELTMRMTQKYVWQNVQKIRSDTRPLYYKEAISNICRLYNEQTKHWPVATDNLLLMEYTLQKRKIQFKGKDFMEFIRYQPMFMGSLKSESDVHNMIETYLINQYLYDEVQKLSPESDPEYVLFKNWLRNQFYLKYFKEKYVGANIDIKEPAIATYYQARKDSLKTFERADITIYKFKTLGEAMSYKQQHYDQNNGSEKKSEPNKQHMTLHRNGNNMYDTCLEQNIEGLEIGAFSNPIKIDDQYCLLELKDTVGAIYIAYDQVKEKLRQELYSAKEKEEYNKQLENLKSLYKIKINKTI